MGFQQVERQALLVGLGVQQPGQDVGPVRGHAGTADAGVEDRADAGAAAPWTRTRPATEATRWELPASDAANRSRSATSRTRPAASASWPVVIACWPTTASLVTPACPTVTVPSGQHPSSHGLPAGWLSSPVARARSAAATGRADSWSSRTTHQDGTAPKLANLTEHAPPGQRRSGWRFLCTPPGPRGRTQSDCFLVTASFGPVPPIPVIFLNEPAAVSVGRS